MEKKFKRLTNEESETNSDVESEAGESSHSHQKPITDKSETDCDVESEAGESSHSHQKPITLPDIDMEILVNNILDVILPLPDDTVHTVISIRDALEKSGTLKDCNDQDISLALSQRMKAFLKPKGNGYVVRKDEGEEFITTVRGAGTIGFKPKYLGNPPKE